MKWRAYHTVWAVLWFGWLSNYAVRIALSPVLLSVREEFGRSHGEAGLLMSVFFYAYAAMQLPAGYLGDRLGRKRILVWGALMWGVMAFLTGWTPSFAWLLGCRFLTGLAEGVYFGSDRPVIAAVTPPEKMALGQGLSFTGLGLGMSLGLIAAGWIHAHWGWRAVFQLLSLPALLASFLLFRFLPEEEGNGVAVIGYRLSVIGNGKTENRKPKTVPPSFSFLTPHSSLLTLVFRRFDLWMIYLAGIAAIYASWTAQTWAPAMFEELGLRNRAAAAYCTSVYGLAALPALPLMGAWSDHLAQRGRGRKMLVALCLLVFGGLMAAFGYGLDAGAPVPLMVGLLFLIGVVSWGLWAPLFSLVTSLVPSEVRGTTFGLMNAIHFLGAILAPWLTGQIRDATGSFVLGAYSATALLLGAAVLMASVRPAFRWGPEMVPEATQKGTL